ncbi:hypothetical protein D3C87_2201900 [compost metagenome]
MPGADFGCFPAFNHAIHLDQTFSHHGFALTAAVGNALQFEQVAQGDIVTFELKC